MRNFLIKTLILTGMLVMVNANIIQSEVIPGAPTAPVRTPAEFEPVRSVFLQWANAGDDEKWDALYRYLVDSIHQAGATVRVLVPDQAHGQKVRTHCVIHDIPVPDLIYCDNLGRYTRDWIPQTIYHNYNNTTIKSAWVDSKSSYVGDVGKAQRECATRARGGKRNR